MPDITKGTIVRDAQGTRWVVVATGKARIVGTPTAQLRCLQPGAGMAGLDVGHVTTRSQQGLTVEEAR